MKASAFHLFLFLSLSFLVSCSPRIQHADPFYNVNDDFSMSRIPLIAPIEINQLNSSSPWDIELQPGMWIDFPDSHGLKYLYGHVHDPEKFAVTNDIIVAYSAYLDKKAPRYIKDHFYHWFVVVPDKEITRGFQTEDEFRLFIQTLGVADPDWQKPDEAYQQFRQTGCLKWIPDCK